MSKHLLISFLRKIAEASFGPMLHSQLNESTLEAIAAQNLMKLTSVYIPWSKAALSHQGMATILNDILFNQRKTILELGSGISTVYIAKLLKQIGRGHLYSLEQDASWLEVVLKVIQDEDVSEYVTLLHVPLAECAHALTPKGQWYEESLINQKITFPIDTLIIDGPVDYPEAPDPLIRYAALPTFFPLLSFQCAVFIDDATRKGERKILSLWEKELKTTFRQAGKLAFTFRGKHYKPFL